jgi:hypothetical protein
MKHKIEGQFAPRPRDLLQSKAWAAVSVHVRRLVEFLELEHLRHGGQENGLLMSPRRQLRAFGIHSRSISAAIEDGVKLGLIDVCRGSRRRPSLYTLTWLHLHDGTPPNNRFTECDAAAEAMIAAAKQAKRRFSSWQTERPSRSAYGYANGTQNFKHANGTQSWMPNGVQNAANEHANGTQQSKNQGHANGTHYLEEALPGMDQDKNRTLEDTAVPEALPGKGAVPETRPGKGVGHIAASASTSPSNDDLGEISQRALDPNRLCRWYVTNNFGYRLCGEPVIPGTELCAIHALQVSAREHNYRRQAC